MPPALVTFTTDFGTRDPYAAEMKGVLSARCPGVWLLDLTHEIAPQNIREAAYFLACAAPHFPAGTIHVVVVDPGVGTDRKAVALRAGGQFIVCPDNGVSTWALRRMPLEAARAIENPEFMLDEVSPTFHGRDVFAPAAAMLALGAGIEEAGPEVKHLVSLSPAEAAWHGDELHGAVIHIDRFGNVITSINAECLTPSVPMTIRIGTHTIEGVHRTYAAVEPGTMTALIGSSGRLEIAVNQGSADAVLGVGLGAPVYVTRSAASNSAP